MLTPEYLLHAVEPAEEIADQLHTDIVNRIVERILIRFKRGDSYILTPLDKWQIETLQQAGFLLDDIQKKIAAATGKMQSEIAEAMEDAGVKALDYDDSVYRRAGLDPVPLVQSPYLINIMQRDYEATASEWSNFTRTTANAAQQAFIQACDDAYHQAIAGMISPSQAVGEALEKIIDEGVYVKYPSGHTDTIETATARAVRTGISQASAHIQTARMDEFDVDLVLVSSHLGARPTHHVWQGKIYSRSGTDKKYPDFVSSTGYGTGEGLCGWNCRHNFGPYFEGMGNPFEQYDSEENLKQYELEQRQRTLERRIRNTKRQAMGWKTAMDAEDDPVKKVDYESKYQSKAALLQKQNAAYNQYCKDNNLKKRSDRISIAKWDRKQAAQARAAAKKHQKSIENSKDNDILKLGTRYVNKNDLLFKYAEKIRPIPGFEDVITHGDPVSLIFTNADGLESNVSAEEFVSILRQDPNYHGGNIRLIACQTASNGGHIPKYIARNMNITVVAPTETVVIDRDGNMILADNDEDALAGNETGEWLVFEPGKEGIKLDLYRKIR